MTISDSSADQSWGELITLDAEEREARMRDRYQELATLAREERRRRMRAMAEAEYALPDDQLRVFTFSRLRVWLALSRDLAAQTAADYDAVMTQMPGPVAMRRVATVQTVARQLSAEDEERLRELVPHIFAGQPHRLHTESTAAAAPAAVTESRRRPWWAFWKK
jgi:hypothetical protein